MVIPSIPFGNAQPLNPDNTAYQVQAGITNGIEFNVSNLNNWVFSAEIYFTNPSQLTELYLGLINVQDRPEFLANPEQFRPDRDYGLIFTIKPSIRRVFARAFTRLNDYQRTLTTWWRDATSTSSVYIEIIKLRNSVELVTYPSAARETILSRDTISTSSLNLNSSLILTTQSTGANQTTLQNIQLFNYNLYFPGFAVVLPYNKDEYYIKSVNKGFFRDNIRTLEFEYDLYLRSVRRAIQNKVYEPLVLDLDISQEFEIKEPDPVEVTIESILFSQTGLLPSVEIVPYTTQDFVLEFIPVLGIDIHALTDLNLEQAGNVVVAETVQIDSIIDVSGFLYNDPIVTQIDSLVIAERVNPEVLFDVDITQEVFTQEETFITTLNSIPEIITEFTPLAIGIESIASDVLSFELTEIPALTTTIDIVSFLENESLTAETFQIDVDSLISIEDLGFVGDLLLKNPFDINFDSVGSIDSSLTDQLTIDIPSISSLDTTYIDIISSQVDIISELIATEILPLGSPIEIVTTLTGNNDGVIEPLEVTADTVIDLQYTILINEELGIEPNVIADFNLKDLLLTPIDLTLEGIAESPSIFDTINDTIDIFPIDVIDLSYEEYEIEPINMDSTITLDDVLETMILPIDSSIDSIVEVTPGFIDQLTQQLDSTIEVSTDFRTQTTTINLDAEGIVEFTGSFIEQIETFVDDTIDFAILLNSPIFGDPGDRIECDPLYFQVYKIAFDQECYLTIQTRVTEIINPVNNVECDPLYFQVYDIHFDDSCYLSIETRVTQVIDTRPPTSKICDPLYFQVFHIDYDEDCLLSIETGVTDIIDLT